MLGTDAGAAVANDPAGAAGSAAGAVMNLFGSSEGIQRNAALPLTAGGDMYSVDRSARGTVQIINPSSTAFLTILVQPGTTGDLTTVRIGQDTDFDGTVDYSTTLPMPVSGVCANGFISCDAGTWDHCLAYSWQSDADGKVSSVLTTFNKVGGCYCINNSCGSRLSWDNLGLILKDIGGGVVGAIQQSKPDYVVTEVSLHDTTISYYGQDSTSSSADTQQTRYYADAGNITSDAQDLVLSQSSNPDSYYSAMQTSFANRGSAYDFQTCSIVRTITVDSLTIADVVSKQGGTGEVLSCGKDCIRLVLGKLGDNYWCGSCDIHEENYSVYIHRPELINKATLVEAYWDDYIQVWIGSDKVYNGPNNNFPPETSGPCELAVSWHKYIGKDVTEYFRRGGLIDTKVRVSVAGCGEGYAYVDINIAGLCAPRPDVVVDNCRALDANPDCRLKEEVVDGVTVYSNYNPTNLTPLPSTQVIGDADCSVSITRDWWRKDREYICQSNTTFSFDDAQQRVGTITASTMTGSTGSKINFTDKRKDESGAWTTDSHSIDLPAMPSGEDCRYVCKTRKPNQDTQAGFTGVTTDYRSSNQSWIISYKECPGNTTCPLEPGEEVVKPCQCLSEFAEATSILAVLDQAGKDLICSDGVPK